MKTVAVHQPNILPWAGYFNKMWHSDVFVLFSNVLIADRGYTHRTKIGLDELKWVTIQGVKKRQRIKDIKLAPDSFISMIEKINYTYKDAPFQSRLDPIIEKLKEMNHYSHLSLAYANTILIKLVIEILNDIEPFGVNIVEYDHEDDYNPTDRLEYLTLREGGDIYLAGGDGSRYMELDRIESITLSTQVIKPETYKGSIVTLLAHVENPTAYVKHCGYPGKFE